VSGRYVCSTCGGAIEYRDVGDPRGKRTVCSQCGRPLENVPGTRPGDPEAPLVYQTTKEEDS
jgi:ribosomal protein L34E